MPRYLTQEWLDEYRALATAQPSTVILKLFKIAVRVVQCKDRVKLHLPSRCPVKAVLRGATEILFQVPEPAWNTS